MPEGGKNIKRYAKLNEKLLKMRSVIRIKNRSTDEMCCARAIVTGIARIEKDPNYSSISQSYGKQANYARALHKEAGVPFGKCGIEEIKRFENTHRMQNYKVMVISKENLNAVIYVGPEDREHTIYLSSHDDNYDLVTSLSAFYQKSYFCEKCLKGYESKVEHKCQNTCKLCRSDDCPSTLQQDEFKHCDKCNRKFKDDQCFQNHIDTNVCFKL